MKKLSLIIGIVIINLAFFGSVFADNIDENAAKQAEDLQKQLIKIKCSKIKFQIDKTKVNDRLTRVNYGQSYESILNNYMTPINLRLVENRYHKTDLLVKETHNFENNLNQFRSKYKKYYKKIDKLSNINCQENTDEFYKTLKEVQTSRKNVKQEIIELEDSFDNYQKTFQEIINEK